MILIDVPMPTGAIDCPCNEGEDFWCRVLQKHCQGKPLDECPLIDAEASTEVVRKKGKWIRKSPTAWMWTCICS